MFDFYDEWKGFVGTALVLSSGIEGLRPVLLTASRMNRAINISTGSGFWRIYLPIFNFQIKGCPKSLAVFYFLLTKAPSSYTFRLHSRTSDHIIFPQTV